ncbi:cyanoexosortase B [Leptolyngbya sp. FACHB-711]|uniref:cyanoexosortase B n=1 Tax=unclassified Leptolyngbya TaxID=2650499 RepID=UPI0016896F63|nr:cyanoexosortase B [Leptolyngbya sp. FACHB-711]MBD1851133.1 cyanoexosortase B [Cyanobacteria bacterium FACHB-502]MBD2025899.1 cyanoexosortase B [Leptolyngbya sp. FACHB-711]
MHVRQKLDALPQQLPILAIGGLLLLLYTPLLLHWIDGWINKSISTEHEYFSHGLLGLPFAAYLVWSKRHRWQTLPDRTHLGGMVLLTLGLVWYLSPLPDAINLSLPILLAGLCLWLKGIPGLRLQAFPLLLVLLATPNSVPYLLVPYTLPLQRFIAGVAGFLLVQAGMPVRVDEIYLFVNDRVVEVAPYCAGLKMLFTSLYVGMILLYWTGARMSRSQVMRLLAGILLLNLIANIIRNALLTYFYGTAQEAGFHWLHDGWGGDLFSTVLLGLIVLLMRWIDRQSNDTAPQPTDF